MNHGCPRCERDLRWRYLGAGTPRCPHCQSRLRYNPHPAEAAPSWTEEIGLLAAGFVAMALFIALGLEELFGLIGLIALATIYLVRRMRRTERAVPDQWPRWIEGSSRSDR